jgi:hypothetical protein
VRTPLDEPGDPAREPPPAAARLSAIGLFEKIKQRVRLAAATEEPSQELGDLVEPGSTVEVSGGPLGSAAGATGLEQLQGLRDSGLIDANTFELIEKTMANPTAELDRLHASGVMSDEIYAQAIASMPVTSAADASIASAGLDLLQRGESATATVLVAPQPTGGANARLSLKLEVHPAAGTPYEAECTVAAAHPGRQPKAGDFLPVMIDPDDPKRVAVDWTAFGT